MVRVPHSWCRFCFFFAPPSFPPSFLPPSLSASLPQSRGAGVTGFTRCKPGRRFLSGASRPPDQKKKHLFFLSQNAGAYEKPTQNICTTKKISRPTAGAYKKPTQNRTNRMHQEFQFFIFSDARSFFLEGRGALFLSVSCLTKFSGIACPRISRSFGETRYSKTSKAPRKFQFS